MTVAKFTQPDFNTQSAAAYKAAIDAATAVMMRIAVAFAPHAQDTPNMTVRVDAGTLFNGVTLTEVAAQNTGTITAPVTNPRIDRVVVDVTTGAVAVIAGTEAASPAPPAIPAGKLPIGQVLLQISSTTITNGMITDERAMQAVSAFSTGDAKLTFKNVADGGWVMANDGSIGSAASGATTRANADTEALYTLMWNNISNTWAPVSSGRGASAAVDFAANKTLTLPRALGRALALSGAGSGLTARALGEYLGAETHQLSQAETPVKSHAHGVTDPGHSHGVTDPGHVHGGVGSLNQDDIAGGAQGQYGNGANTSSSTTGISVNGAATGISVNAAADATASAHPNMQPSAFLNVMIKL